MKHLKRLMILIVCLISFNIFCQNFEELKSLPEKMSKEHEKLTKEEIYQKWRTERQASIEKDGFIKEKDKQLLQSIKEMEDLKKIITSKWYPKFGIKVNSLAGWWYNSNIDPAKPVRMDTYIILELIGYFWQAHGYISGGAGYKLYDTNGGCITLGFGFNL